MPYEKGDQDELTDIEELMAVKLRSRQSFVDASMPVLTQQLGNLQQQADAEENKNFCVVLFPLESPFTGQNTTQLLWEGMTAQFRVIVNPELQEAGAKGARWWAIEILKEFHAQRLDDPDYEGATFYGSAGRVNPQPVDHKKLNIFDVFLTSQLSLTQA